MRKALCTIAMASLFLAWGINANAQLKWSVKAGLNVSSYSGGIEEDPDRKSDYDSYSLEQGSKPGFHVGINLQYMFTPQVGIETGLLYSTLGTKITEETGNSSSPGEWEYKRKSKETLTISPAYLQLPISVLYKFNLGQDLFLYPSVGLYAGYGIGGIGRKWKDIETYTYHDGETTKTKTGTDTGWRDFFGKQDVDDEEDKEDKEDKEITNRFDIGLTTGLTLQYSKFTFGLGYDLGLSMVNKKGKKDKYDIEEYYYWSGNKKNGWKNRNFKVSVGYFF